MHFNREQLKALDTTQPSTTKSALAWMVDVPLCALGVTLVGLL